MRLRQLEIIGSDSSQTSADTSDSLGDRSFDSASNKSKSPQYSPPNKKTRVKNTDSNTRNLQPANNGGYHSQIENENMKTEKKNEQHNVAKKGGENI